MEKLKLQVPETRYFVKMKDNQSVDSVTFVDAVWKEHWNYIPRILFIDGTFLKNNIQGVLLVIMGINGNKKQTPLAIHYCQNESSENWRIFFTNAISVYSDWINDELPLVIFSDRLVGLDAVITNLFPHAVHKMCLFHISQNIKQKFKCKKEISKLVYKTGKSFTKEQFESNSLKLKNANEDVYNYLMSIPLKSWVLCYSEFPCMLYTTTSPIESFNRVILKERKSCLIDLLIGIRNVCSQALLKQKRKLLVQYCGETNVLMFNSIFNETNVENLKTIYTPYFCKTVEKQVELSYIYTVEQYDSFFLVNYKETKKEVKYSIIENKIYFECNCNYTKYASITCRHIFAVLRHISMDGSHLNNNIFTLYSIYKICSETYAYVERPILDKEKHLFDKAPTKSKKGAPKINRYKTTN